MRRLLLAVVALSALTVPPAAAGHINEGDVRFKVTCNWSHSLPDDPIVYPNQPGAAHLHEFFGNTSVDASTVMYADLLAGSTVCNDGEDLAGYWTPAAFDAAGERIVPGRMTAYYRRGEKHGTIEPFPNGLKIVADGVYQCRNAAGQLIRSSSPDLCVTSLALEIRFPDCWNGATRDSADHRSHMAFSAWSEVDGANVCPASHPVPVPALTTYTNYPDGTVIDHLSSGGHDTLHGDFFNGWVRPRLRERIETCLNQLQRCDSGG